MAAPTPPTTAATTVEASNQPLVRLPPPLNPTTKTVILDLDHTLIHSAKDNAPFRYDFMVKGSIDGVPTDFYILKRPGVDELLTFLGSRFEVVLFTAGSEEYASPVLDELDRNRVISHRLYRDSCKEIDGNYVKDLSEMGRDLKKVVLVDDNPKAFILQPDNAIEIRPFVNDMADKEIKRLMEFFTEHQDCEDFREAILDFAPFGWNNPLY